MAEENVSSFDIIDIFKDDMYVWVIDPNSSPQSKRYLLSKFIQEMRISYAVDTGTANAYAIALKSTLTSYIQGQSFSFKAVNANTGPSTINIDGVGIKSIKSDSTDLQPNDISSGSINIIQFDGTDFQLLSKGVSSNLTFACSDEVTDLEVATSVTSFRIVGAKTITGVRASVNTAPTGSVLTVDINKNGTSILSTKLTIDATEKTSTTAAIPAVISTASIADDDEITVDIDSIGSTIAGKGLKVSLLF